MYGHAVRPAHNLAVKIGTWVQSRIVSSQCIGIPDLKCPHHIRYGKWCKLLQPSLLLGRFSWSPFSSFRATHDVFIRGHFPLLIGDCLVLRQNSLLLYSFYLYSLILSADPDRHPSKRDTSLRRLPVWQNASCTIQHGAPGGILVLSLFYDLKNATYSAWETCSSESTHANIPISPKTALRNLLRLGRWLDRYCQHHTYPLSLIYWLRQFTFRKLTYYQTKERAA